MRHYNLSAVVFFTSLLVLFGCTPKIKPADKSFPVRVLVVKPRAIAATIRLSGTVESKVRATVIAPVEGNIQSLAVTEGSRVRQGQVLCYLVSTDYQNLLGQSESDLQRLQNKLAQSPMEDKELLTSQIQQAEERLAAARRLYQPTPVVSPITGTVIYARIETGDNVLAKQPLFDVAELSSLIVRSAVSVEYLNKIKTGQRVSVTLQSEKEPLTSCRLGTITPNVRIESRTSDIEIILPRGVAALPGESADIELNADQRSQALTAPNDALIVRPDGSKNVFIVNGGRAKLIPVQLGIETNEVVEILKGLSAGDSLVVWGQENLKDGVTVKLPEAMGAKAKQASGK